MLSSVVGWMLEAVRFMAGEVIGNLGFGGVISVIAGAVLLFSLAANALKFISRPKGIAFAAVAALFGLCLVWWMPPKPKAVETQKIVREVVREIPPPVVGALHSRIAGLEAKQRHHKEEQARKEEAARREAEAQAAQAQERIRQLERDIQLARKPEEEPKPPAPLVNGECYQCGHLMYVGRGLAGEDIRCPHCDTIMSARRAWARRSYTLNGQKYGRKPPIRSFAPVAYADMFE